MDPTQETPKGVGTYMYNRGPYSVSLWSSGETLDILSRQSYSSSSAARVTNLQQRFQYANSREKFRGKKKFVRTRVSHDNPRQQTFNQQHPQKACHPNLPSPSIPHTGQTLP